MTRQVEHITIVNAGTLFHRHDPGYAVIDLDGGAVTFHRLGRLEGETLELGNVEYLRGRGVD